MKKKEKISENKLHRTRKQKSDTMKKENRYNTSESHRKKKILSNKIRKKKLSSIELYNINLMNPIEVVIKTMEDIETTERNHLLIIRRIILIKINLKIGSPFYLNLISKSRLEWLLGVCVVTDYGIPMVLKFYLLMSL